MSKTRTKPASMSWREWCRIEDERLGRMSGSKTALRALRDQCKRKGVNISLKGLFTPKSLLESLAEAIEKYRAVLAENPSFVPQMTDSTAFADRWAKELARLISVGKPLTEQESQDMTDAITEINVARYRIQNKTQKSAPWATVGILAVVIGAAWYFGRERE